METQEETKGEETKESKENPSEEKKAFSENPESRGANSSVLDEAKAIVERQEKANIETKKLLDRQEKIVAENMLAGKGYAGGPINRSPTEKDKAIEFWGADSPVGNAIKNHTNPNLQD